MNNLSKDLEKARQLLREKPSVDAEGRRSGCVAYLMRSLDCPYNHAAYLMNLLEQEGFVSKIDEQGRRKLLQENTDVD